MPIASLLIATRGEIAIRIARAAGELGIHTIAVYAEDDAASLHVRRADEARPLTGRGPHAYLDSDQLVALARQAGCDAVHPGEGFLSGSAVFAARCAVAGLVFVGPPPETVELFADKARARAFAESLDVPVVRGTSGETTLVEARKFFRSLDGLPMIIKAVAGGGGRGTAAVYEEAEIEEAFERCRSEARAAFGDPALYVERLVPRARHVEVQIIGDGTGEVTHLWERDCTLQERFKKLVDVSPSPALAAGLRHRILATAGRLAAEARLANLGTFEFLVDASQGIGANHFAFIEASTRLQVEHTVTEEVTGVDLVRAQLLLAGGASLRDIQLLQSDVAAPKGFALQCRVNLETTDPAASNRPSAGTISAFEVPSGRGVRTDASGYAGYTTNPALDTLLAKVIVQSPSPSWSDVLRKARRALGEFRIEGVSTNLPFLIALLGHPDVSDGHIHTRFVEEHVAELAAAATA